MTLNLETSEILICVDCMILLANGELPTDPDDRVDPPLSKITDDVDITPGGDHDDWCPAKDVTARHQVECECDRIDFSTARCGGCGSELGGERYKATLWFSPTDTQESTHEPAAL